MYGKAFEYACAFAIEDKYRNLVEVILCDSDPMRTAEDFYHHLDEEQRVNYKKAAQAAVKILHRLEPKLSSITSPLFVELQSDSRGIAGDVRDVLCIRNDGWELGLSCKHNHEAVKHSRLSDKIDFGKEWFGKSCSDTYFSEVRKIFTPLRKIRDDSKVNGSPALWAHIDDKEETCYIPVLKAFMAELVRLDEAFPGEIPALLVRYLIGRNDFYKVIMNENRHFTEIESVNINGTLNQSDGKRKAILGVPVLKLPTKFYEIGFKEGQGNTIVVVCDQGWNISMRIHNASSKVEPSLKFDVRLIAMPSSILRQIEPWD